MRLLPHLGHRAGRHHFFSCWVPTVLHPKSALQAPGSGEVRRGSRQPTCKGKARGLWPLGPAVGRERGSVVPGPTSETRPHPAGSLSAPALGHRLPQGSRNTHNLPKLQGQLSGLREAAPAKGPQTNCSKNRLGVAEELLGWPRGGG